MGMSCCCTMYCVSDDIIVSMAFFRSSIAVIFLLRYSFTIIECISDCHKFKFVFEGSNVIIYEDLM